MLYNNDDVRNLYLDIDRILKRDNTLSFEDLQKRLRKQINFQDKCENQILGDLLLEYAVENDASNVIEFLLKNGVNIINVISQESRTYHIITKNGKSILNYTIENCSNKTLKLLLQSINTEQSMLKPESELYKLYKQFKDNALFTAVAKDNVEAVRSLMEFGANPKAKESGKAGRTVLEIAKEQGNQEIITLLENAINKKKGEQSTSSSSNGNASSRPIATVTPMSTTVNGQLNNNNENVDNQSTVTPTEQNTGADGFISGQFSVSKEAKYKENKKDFYTSLGKDIAGIIATGLLITAAVMVPFVAGTIIFGVLAALVAIGTFIHVLGNTLPSHDEMKGNQIEHTGFQEARYKG